MPRVLLAAGVQAQRTWDFILSIVWQGLTGNESGIDCHEPLNVNRTSPIPIIGRTAPPPSQTMKIPYNHSHSLDKVSTNFHKARKPEVCTDIGNGQNVFRKLWYPQQNYKIERLNRKGARKQPPVKPLYFVCLSPLFIDFCTSKCTEANPVAIVRPWESWRGGLVCDPPWHLPGVWSNQPLFFCAEHECQVGAQASKPANLKLFGSECGMFLKSGITDSTVACKPAVRKPGFTSEGFGVARLSNTLPFGSTNGWRLIRRSFVIDSPSLHRVSRISHRKCVGMSCTIATGSSELLCTRGGRLEHFQEQGRTTATKNKEGTYARQRNTARGRWSLRSAAAEQETIEDLMEAAPLPPHSHLGATLTPYPVYFRQPVNKYVHNCIYSLAVGQGQAILLLKPPGLVQPGLRKARGDQGRGDTHRMKHGVPGPSGPLHDVVVAGTIMEEKRDVGAVQVRSGRGERKKESQEVQNQVSTVKVRPQDSKRGRNNQLICMLKQYLFTFFICFFNVVVANFDICY